MTYGIGNLFDYDPCMLINQVLLNGVCAADFRLINGQSYLLNIDAPLYICGQEIIKHALVANLFRVSIDEAPINELHTSLLADEIVSEYSVHVYCGVFLMLFYKLQTPVINEVITDYLCDLLGKSSDLVSEFSDAEALDFENEPSLFLTDFALESTEGVQIPYIVTQARKAQLAEQFGAEFQLFESFNSKLQELDPANAQLLVFSLNIFRQIIGKSNDAASDLDYLSIVFTSSILSATASSTQKLLKAVFTVLIFGVGAVVPDLYCDVSAVGVQRPPPIPQVLRELQGSATSSKTVLGYGTAEEAFSDSDDDIDEIVGGYERDEEPEMLPDQADVMALLEELKLNPASAIGFKCGKPLLQHLALPPAKSATLINAKH